MVTIKQLALLADVSPSTISNVLHGRTNKMTDEVLERVQRLIRANNYVSNMSGRSLGRYGSRIIVVVRICTRREELDAVHDPFFSEMVRALEQEIRSNGYFMMLYISVNIEESVRMAHSWNAEGIITVGGTPDECQRLMRSTQVPLVFVDGYFHDDGLSYINAGLCDYEGSFMMTEYLISQGHRRVAFLANMEKPFGVDEERLRGYKAALLAHDIPFSPADYIPISDRLYERHAQLITLLRKDLRRYTALFFVSDYLAADSICFLYDNGVRVPDDLSVCGFDDNIFASTVRPALTTVHQDVSLKAVHAVRQALRLIRKEPLEEHDIRLPVSLRIRESVHNVNKLGDTLPHL